MKKIFPSSKHQSRKADSRVESARTVASRSKRKAHVTGLNDRLDRALRLSLNVTCEASQLWSRSEPLGILKALRKKSERKTVHRLWF